MYFPKGRFDGSRKLLVLLYVVGAMLAANSLGPWFVSVVEMPEGKPPVVKHDSTLLVLVGLTLITMFAVHTNLRRKLRESQGFGRRQIQFVLRGARDY